MYFLHVNTSLKLKEEGYIGYSMYEIKPLNKFL